MKMIRMMMIVMIVITIRVMMMMMMMIVIMMMRRIMMIMMVVLMVFSEDVSWHTLIDVRTDRRCSIGSSSVRIVVNNST